MARDGYSQHPHLERGGELYTPKDQALMALLEEVRVACGSWKSVVRQARMSTRYLRMIRNDDGRVAVSMAVMDKILSRTGFAGRLDDLPWYTPDQLVEIGVWKPHNTDGLVGSKRNRERQDA